MMLKLILTAFLGLFSGSNEDRHYWNQFIDEHGMSELADVDPDFREELLVFRYFSEVYNGGHLQYFLNLDDYPWEETADAMENMGAREHARILRRAIVVWRAEQRKPPRTAEEFVEEAQKDELGEFDSAMYRLKPIIEDYLDKSIIQKYKRR
ncbi:DMP19 family protein [Oricola sp.]|uniref:DMP19 family protein n=1 Tax=Oricola sp. TaxID=1979950 RepID=UPI003BAC0BA5